MKEFLKKNRSIFYIVLCIYCVLFVSVRWYDNIYSRKRSCKDGKVPLQGRFCSVIRVAVLRFSVHIRF